jgi:hypothetical protein
VERSLDFLLQGAGLIPVEAAVAVPVLTLGSWRRGNATDAVVPVETRPSGALADLYFFWMVDCEPCREGLDALSRLDADPSLASVVSIRVVAVDTDISSFYGNDLAASHWKRETFVDSKGGFAERLGVLGAPGVVLSDADGRVIARFNGAIDFESPGFELLTSTLKQMRKASLQHPESKPMPLSATLLADVKMTPQIPAKFLGVPLMGYFLLFSLLLVCYAVGKSVMRLRKNSFTSRKSS